MKINQNLVSKEIAAEEGGKKNLSIAQIKEVQKIFLKILFRHWRTGNEVGVITLIKNARK